MKHFSFQLVDLGRILTNIDKARYLDTHSNRTPAGEVDNDDPEFLLNRILTYFNIGAKVNDGCVVGLFYGVSEAIKNRLEDYKSAREQEKINGTNILEEFDNFELGHVWRDQGIHLIGVGGPNRTPSLFTIADKFETRFVQQGFSTQLEDINADNDIFEIKTAKYVIAAANSIIESDMLDGDKTELMCLMCYLFSCLPLNASNLHPMSNLDVDASIRNLISYKMGYAYPNELQNEDLIKCLKQARALEGYNIPAGEFNYPNFTIWALLVSIGEEGVSDDCCLENITIGDHVTYETEVSYPINVQVEITPLPRNRCKVNYTITANPGNNGNLEFKITY